jgi:hypothetical protein
MSREDQLESYRNFMEVSKRIKARKEKEDGERETAGNIKQAFKMA